MMRRRNSKASWVRVVGIWEIGWLDLRGWLRIGCTSHVLIPPILQMNCLWVSVYVFVTTCNFCAYARVFILKYGQDVPDKTKSHRVWQMEIRALVSSSKRLVRRKQSRTGGIKNERTVLFPISHSMIVGEILYVLHKVLFGSKVFGYACDQAWQMGVNLSAGK